MRILRLIVLWAAVLVVGSLMGYRRYIQHEASAVVHAELAKHRERVDSELNDYEKKLIASRELLERLPKGEAGDAGKTLNPLIKWKFADGTTAFKTPSGLAAFLKTSASPLIERLPKWGKDWVIHANEIEFGDIDFSWMAELKRFDHWELDEAPERRQALSVKDVLPTSLAVPLPNVFDGWVQLRLLKGIRTKDLASAVRETSQLCALLIRSELAPIARAGLEYLRFQKQAADYYKAKIDTGYVNNRLPSDSELDSAIAVLSKTQLFFSLMTDEESLGELFSGHGVNALACAAVNSNSERIVRSRVLLGDVFPRQRTIMSRIMKEDWSSCKLRALRPYWESERATTADLAMEPYLPPEIPELVGFEYAFIPLDLIAKLSRRDQGRLPAILEYSSALRRLIGARAASTP